MQTSIEAARVSREGSSERRKSASPRIPVDLLVELCAAEEPKKGDRMLDSWSDVGDAFADAYDADGLDLSATGLRLRSAVLPDVGQRLRCRFGHLTGGGRDAIVLLSALRIRRRLIELRVGDERRHPDLRAIAGEGPHLARVARVGFDLTA